MKGGDNEERRFDPKTGGDKREDNGLNTETDDAVNAHYQSHALKRHLEASYATEVMRRDLVARRRL